MRVFQDVPVDETRSLCFSRFVVMVARQFAVGRLYGLIDKRISGAGARNWILLLAD